MWHRLKENNIVSYFSLFTSFGTLLCCAIPSTLVLLGFGASLAGFLGEFPGLIWLSENKGVVFGLSVLMLGISWFTQRSLVCPIDKKADCESARNWSKPIFYLALVINIIGAFYAFLLPRLL